MANTGDKYYLDETGLNALVIKIKDHINNTASGKIQKIQYDNNKKELQWTKNGTTWEGTSVSTWVQDIYLKSVSLTTLIGTAADGKTPVHRGLLKFNLNNSTEAASVDLSDWFNPALYLTTANAGTTYLTTDAAKAYLTTANAGTTYLTTDGILTLSTTKVGEIWQNPAI